MKIWLRQLILSAFWCLPPGFAAMADPGPKLKTTGTRDLKLEVGRFEPGEILGFGWSRAERSQGKVFRWIKQLEADVDFKVDEVRDLQLSLDAAPLYLNWQRQRIGVYLNNRYFGEWTCPDSGKFRVYSAVIPARFFKEGKNRLTFRMGYRKKLASDTRELSLAVSSITFKRL